MTRARLVLVHGRAQQGKSEGELIEEWMGPLRETLGARASCLDDVEITAPFYGKRLIELLARMGDPAPEDIIVRGPAGGDLVDDPFYDEESYKALVGEWFDAVRETEGISEERVSEALGGEYLERGPQNWPWVLAIIRTLNRIPGLDGDMIERVLRDVWIYLERRSVRKEIDAIVAPAFDTDLPVVCLAHSLGSVVAYHIVKGRSVGKVSNLITVGSPLGLRICREALAPIKHPSIVGRWFNARDRRDVVALYPLDGKHFSISPAVTHFDGVRNRTSNAHGISGYVTNAEIADEMYRALSVIA